MAAEGLMVMMMGCVYGAQAEWVNEGTKLVGMLITDTRKVLRQKQSLM